MIGAPVSTNTVAIRRIELHAPPAVQIRRPHLRGVHQSVHRPNWSVLKEVAGFGGPSSKPLQTPLQTAILSGAG